MHKIILYCFMAAIICIEPSSANSNYIKIDSSFINKTNNNTLLGQFKGVCPASIQNNAINLKLVFDKNIVPPTCDEIEYGVFQGQLNTLKYEDDFKSDIKDSIKNILSDVCNTTFENNDINNTLVIEFDKFESTKSNINIFDKYFVPFVNKTYFDYSVSNEYKSECKIEGSVLNNSFNYNKNYGSNMRYTYSYNYMSGITESNVSEQIKYLDTNTTLFNLDLNSFMVIFGKNSFDMSYKLNDQNNNVILQGTLDISSLKWRGKVEFQKLSDYKAIRMLNRGYQDRLKFHDIDITERIKEEAEDEDDNDNLNGIYSFMIYDIVKSIIENAK